MGKVFSDDKNHPSINFFRPHSGQGIADLNNKQHFFEKLSNLCTNRANSQIGIKCDFRDWPRITFEAVADDMFASFH